MEVGRIRELVRYPVKSMAGVAVESASLGWQGFDGDRRFAFRRVGDGSNFPFLSASRFPELILYQPDGATHVRTPAGRELELNSAELQTEITERSGVPVELMHFKHGIFDEASVSVISLATIAGIGREVGAELDRRRFRANILLETENTEVFHEDAWVGGTLTFGDCAIRVTMRDLRCMMVNLDPDTAKQDARVMKTVVGLNANLAGVYGTVIQTGTVHLGQTVYLA
ncbi:MAG TPA: MOSC N-terminal beta barrel domain-containing protein [Thermoanaerobaculia bacterium]|nr:MOSC N-terminal beta barrel domain-containing protein [Thermoanaerobaculia bacterium]